jgi:membrane fusion protein, heavy metal efflux system
MSASRMRCPTLAVAALAISLVACGKRPEADTGETRSTADSVVLDSAQKGQIRTEQVVAGPFDPVISTTGTVAFNGDHSTAVLSPMSGPVSRILVSPGAVVSRGQALATVSSPDFAEAIASYRKAESALRNAQRIATLDEQLFANDALARRDLDQARTDLSAASADRDAAVQAMRALGVDEASITAIREGQPAPGAAAAIRAPLAGTVVEKNITPGQLLEAGTTQAFTIADLSTVWVMANVFEGDVAAVQKGDPATITTSASADSFPGRVDYIAALVDPASKATAVRILVPNRGHMLKRDMLVQVRIRSSKKRAGILVPVSAVLRDDENLPYVYLQDSKGAYTRHRIELGDRIGDRYQVLSGLESGQKLVTEGALFLAGSGAS